MTDLEIDFEELRGLVDELQERIAKLEKQQSEPRSPEGLSKKWRSVALDSMKGLLDRIIELEKRLTEHGQTMQDGMVLRESWLGELEKRIADLEKPPLCICLPMEELIRKYGDLLKRIAELEAWKKYRESTEDDEMSVRGSVTKGGDF